MTDYEFLDAQARRQNHRTQEAVADLLARIDEQAAHINDLEFALSAIVRAVALDQTTLPDEDKGLISQDIAQALAQAAHALHLNVKELHLNWMVTCPHGEDPAFCNECHGIYDEP